jgi:hypothetical protein
MLYLLDGTNILGRLGFPRTAVDSQRRLVQAAVTLSRANHAKVVCVFDGIPAERFASRLGQVTVRFAGSRSADDLIVEEARSRDREPVRVVTADAELGARVKRRNVEILAPREVRSFFDVEPATGTREGEDWESYFSDPKNRNV